MSRTGARGDEESSENNATFSSLWLEHQAQLRACISGWLPSFHDVADVMQEVALIAWRKFPVLKDPANDFGRWVRVIAKFQVWNFRRTEARRMQVLEFRDDPEPRHRWVEPEESTGYLARLSALERCLDELAPELREIVLHADGSAPRIAELAQRLGKSPGAVYQQRWRIRQSLVRAMARERAKQPGSEMCRRSDSGSSRKLGR